VKCIIQNGWAVNPAVRYSFDEIWSRLEWINFRLSANVDAQAVSAFVSWVKMVALRPPVPLVNRADMCSYAFLAPQEGLRRSFTLSFERNATAKVVREEVAIYLAALEKWESRVQLLFGGRILRDSIVFDNLQIRDDDVIVVYVKMFTGPGFLPVRPPS
jgi:hypothetical protein